MLDNNNIAFLSAYTLSFINNESLQQAIYKAVKIYGFKLDMKKANQLRQEFESGNLTESMVDLILSGNLEKKESKPKTIKIKPELTQKYFSDKSKTEIDDIIEQALVLYFGGKE
ncbi:hypothetical protein [Scatolibacter rhodanostii]|uniref:hypothetical protein n=1 Tax=Scatolibacter rhodanostii TaxID=2014781 RepID=UPI00117CBAD5|nr:hypothetical protein [Scatolibacter rhodanostii]